MSRVQVNPFTPHKYTRHSLLSLSLPADQVLVYERCLRIRLKLSSILAIIAVSLSMADRLRWTSESGRQVSLASFQYNELLTPIVYPVPSGVDSPNRTQINDILTEDSNQPDIVFYAFIFFLSLISSSLRAVQLITFYCHCLLAKNRLFSGPSDIVKVMDALGQYHDFSLVTCKDLAVRYNLWNRISIMLTSNDPFYIDRDSTERFLSTLATGRVSSLLCSGTMTSSSMVVFCNLKTGGTCRHP